MPDLSAMLETVFVIHLATTLMMSSLIWVIQLVHYPSFHFVDRARFPEFARFHASRISLIVVPLMLIELTSSIVLFFSQNFRYPLLATLNLLLLLAIWVITLLISSRLHGKLQKGYSEPTVRRLISTNWLRTCLWSLRAIVMVYVLLNYGGV